MDVDLSPYVERAAKALHNVYCKGFEGEDATAADKKWAGIVVEALRPELEAAVHQRQLAGGVMELSHVWLVVYDEWPESGGGPDLDAAYRTLDGAVESVKASYGPPHVVTWELVDDDDDPVLTGHFEAVIDYCSTRHSARWRFQRVPIEP